MAKAQSTNTATEEDAKIENQHEEEEDDGSVTIPTYGSKFEASRALSTFMNELKSKCKNILEYKDRDVLVIEVNNLAGNGIAFEWGLLKPGKQKIEILGMDIPKFLSKVATMEDVTRFKTINVHHARKRQLEVKRLIDALNKREGFHVSGKPKAELTEEDLEMKMSDWDSNHNPYKAFREEYGYTILPIRHMKMFDNLGPAMNDAVAKEEKNKDIQAQLAEAQLSAAEDRKMIMKLMEKILSK